MSVGLWHLATDSNTSAWPQVFYPAEGYHQQYLQKGGQSAEKNAPEAVRCYG